MAAWMESWESASGLILQLSVQGTILAACVLMIELAFRSKLAATWRIALWAVVVFRLICPLTRIIH